MFIEQQNEPYVPYTATHQLAGSLALSGTLDSGVFSTTENVELIGSINLAGEIASYPSASAALVGAINLSGEIESAENTATGYVSLAGAINLSGAINSIYYLPIEAPAPILNEVSADAFSYECYTAELTSGGAEIDIKSFRVSAPRGQFGKTVSVQISGADLADADKNANYNFRLGKMRRPFDSPEWWNVLSAGEIFQRSFSQSWLNNSLSFGAAAPLSDKLNRCPKRDLFVYDPAKVDFSIDELKPVYDTNGNSSTPAKRPISNLNLYNALQIALVEGCGFASFRTNIPNYEISRADFTMKGTWLDGVKGFVGVFEPLIFAVGNVVWLVDKTQAIPDEFEPVAISPDDFLNWNQSLGDARPFDGFELFYVENKAQAQYFTERTETKPIPASGAKLEIERRYRDYRSVYNPAVVLATEQIAEERRTFNGGEEILRESWTKTFDSQGNISRQTSQELSFLPAPSNNWEGGLILAKETLARFGYGVNPDNPRETVQTSAVTEFRELVAVDTQQPYLNNEDFRQSALVAHDVGNLKTTMTYLPGLQRTKTIIETLETNGGQVSTNVVEIDHIKNFAPASDNSVRTGSVGKPALANKQKSVYVLKPGLTLANRPGNPIEPFNVGELPARFGEPLAERVLARRGAKKESGSVEFLGYDESIERGTYFALLDEAGERIGIFVVEGFEITGENLGTPGERIATTIEVSEI